MYTQLIVASILESYTKSLKVVNSCETINQLKVSIKYCELFREVNYDNNNQVETYYSELLKQIENKRNEISRNNY